MGIENLEESGQGRYRQWTGNCPTQAKIGLEWATRQQTQTYGSYVSGACGASPLPSCPNNAYPYVHDFGSILAFTEWNFKMPFIDGPPDNGYADYNAPDWDANHTIPPLSDFFGLSQPRPFVSISTPKDYTFFQGYYQSTSTSPQGPDDDEIADD